MKVAISGFSGFVGTHLTDYLLSRGIAVAGLSRADFADSTGGRLLTRISDCDAVINLSGAPISRRWSRDYRQQIITSRVELTRRLAVAIDHSPRTRTFISTSAVGYYPSVGCFDEFSAERGSGFLADLCESWERAAHCSTARTIITRLGVVISPDGGIFPSILWPLQRGFAVTLGGGHQPFSWISIEDLVRAEEFLLVNTNLEGIFNLCRPEPTTMSHFTTLLSAHFHPRFTIQIPSFALRLAMGSAADIMLQGQCVEPTRLLRAGFRFGHSTICDLLKSLVII